MTNVADLRPGGKDALEQKITCLYARKPPEYAVYRVHRRVLVHFADDPHKADEQRKNLSQLAPLRGEIDGLIDGWRDGSTHAFFGLDNSAKLKSKAMRYDRRVGDSLIVALEDDLTGARDILARVKQDILDERVAWARFEYLIAAFCTALGMMFTAWIAASLYPIGGADKASERMTDVGIMLLILAVIAAVVVVTRGLKPPIPAAPDPADVDSGEPPSPPPPPDEGKWSRARPALLLLALIALPVIAFFFAPSFSYDDKISEFATAIDLWRAAAAGAVGAFFSISLGIRSRTVLPDLLRTSNLMDALLRVTIGFIAGAVLMALLKARLVNFHFGDASLADADALAVVIIGFVAGFSERMVPDLLEKANANTAPALPALGGNPAAAANALKRAQQAEGAAAQQTAAPAGTIPAPNEPDPVPQQAGEDACAADLELNDDEVTPDADLPPASGGVAAPGPGGHE